MKKVISIVLVAFLLLLFVFNVMNTKPINTNLDERFTEDGYYITDSTSVDFKMLQPTIMKFYVESSGSMNGFFRRDVPTDFKTDFWRILNYYSPISSPITILKNSGDEGKKYDLSKFQSLMNRGEFLSNASTKVPLMLQTIINNLNIEKGEVAVLVSDMKYSPVGSDAPDVLLSQYSTDISTILGRFNHSVCLIGATSNFYSSQRRQLCDKSPYYYLILGAQQNVAKVRNEISTLLYQSHHLIDNIESGFDYGTPKYSFGITNKCQQYFDQPTFVEYEEVDEADTCMIKLNISLEDYRWILADETVLKNCFEIKSKYGTQVKLGELSIKEQNITGDNHELNRKVTATIDLQVYDMLTDSDVIEWTLKLPNTDYTLFNPFFDGAFHENDCTKSFSVIDFIRGMFQGGVVSKDLKSNFILISKN